MALLSNYFHMRINVYNSELNLKQEIDVSDFSPSVHFHVNTKAPFSGEDIISLTG